jgi:hypothetical protein
MRIANPYTCDYCGKRKEDSNHWYYGVFDSWSFNLWPWAYENTHVPNVDDSIVEHICGAECAAKALAKWMDMVSRSAAK